MTPRYLLINCTNKDGESAFETMTEGIALSENSQSFCLEQAADDEIGFTDLSKRVEKVVSPSLTARSKRHTWAFPELTMKATDSPLVCVATIQSFHH